MYKHLVIMILCASMCTNLSAQKKKISVIGSSTVAGKGATPDPNPINPDNPPDSCWASIVLRYYKSFGLLDTLVNLGRPGSTTFFGLPSGSTYPDGTPMVANLYNVTAALDPNRFDADLVIVSYASNDVDSQWSVHQTMANLRIIYKTVADAGKAAYVTTTQPRSTWDIGVPADNWAHQREERDSILLEFGSHALNFYDPIAAADGNHINALYFFDGIHVNNLGHRQLAQVVENANLLSEQPVTLPIILTGLTATWQQQQVALHWTASDQTGPSVFTIQRSGDGKTFDDLSQIEGFGAASPTDYSWTDEHPLTGKNYYRIKMSEPGVEHYSVTVAVLSTEKAWGIGKIYATGRGAPLSLEVRSPRNQTITVNIINAAGIRIASQVFTVGAPSTTVSVTVPGQAAGVYFLKVIGESGETDIKSYTVF